MVNGLLNKLTSGSICNGERSSKQINLWLVYVMVNGVLNKLTSGSICNGERSSKQINLW